MPGDDEIRPGAVAVGFIVQAFLRAGWRPPTPTDRVADRIIKDIEQQPPNASLDLSVRELEVLSMYANGGNETSIAADLGISRSTVKEHTREARRRLGAKTTTQAVALAVATDLIHIDKGEV